MTRKSRLAYLLSATLMAGSLMSAGTQAAPSAQKSSLWTSGNGSAITNPAYNPGQSLAPLVKSVRGAVVSVTGTSAGGPQGQATPWFMPNAPGPQQGLAQGSGFIVHPDGWVITNHHVVDGQKDIEITLWDGQTLPAKIVGSDPQTDVALLKIKAAKGKSVKLPFVQLGSSDTLDVGDWVVAIGNPMGLQHSVTRGIVSAKSRGDLGLYRQGYADFLQTDAAISPGNSGGPLFNLKGEVIAINTAINRAGNDLGFAVPIDQAKPIIDQLHRYGEVRRGWLGITGSMVHKVKRGQQGALIADVLQAGPAAKGGLKAKDRVLEINGKAIKNFKELRLRVAQARPGETLQLKVKRGAKILEKKVKLARQPTPEELANAQRSGRSPAQRKNLFGRGTPRLGVRVAPDKKGLKVLEVADKHGVAAELGLRPGDIIVKVNGKKISDVDSLRASLTKSNKSIAVVYEREGVMNQTRLKVQ